MVRKMLIQKRLIAAAIDLFIAASLNTLVSLLIGVDLGRWGTIFLGVVLFLLKDISGRSVGKRVLNLILTDATSSQKPNLLKRIFRNIFVVIWPIEVFLLFQKGRRVGDILFNTNVE